MLKEFTQDYMKENCGCYSKEKLSTCSFIKSKKITIQSILESEIRLKDKYWFVVKKCDLTLRQKQEIAIGVAEIVLEIYENKYPNNKAPREAIQAAKDYINGTVITLEELRQKRAAAAADAAYAAAADAAYAAAAAAAADAAAAAYAAAADAAAAAAAAAAAYAAAADAAAAAAADAAEPKKLFNEILLTYLINFVNSIN
jgi:hypothetical protein